MGLRAIHYAEGEWTFVFEDGAAVQTHIRELADYLADEHKVPRNRYGVRSTDAARPGGYLE